MDCVSHGAVAVIKRVSRHATEPYVPLRSSGLSSFAAALEAMALQRHARTTQLHDPRGPHHARRAINRRPLEEVRRTEGPKRNEPPPKSGGGSQAVCAREV